MPKKGKAPAKKKAVSKKTRSKKAPVSKPKAEDIDFLTPELAQESLDMAMGNIRKKVEEGKPLTKMEMGALHQLANQKEGAESGSGSASMAMDTVRSKVDLAKALGISRRTLQNHWNDPGRPPVGADGSYNLMQYRQWAAVNNFGKAVLDDDEELPTKMELEARYMLIRIDHARLKLEEARKHLIPRDDHRAGLKYIAEIFVHALDGLPDRLGVQGFKDDVLNVVESECKRTKSEILRFIEKG